MQARRTQRGLTISGFLFVAFVVVAIVMLGARITPAFIEYYSVRQALGDTLAEAKDPTIVVDLRRAFQRRVDTGYIESVSGKDLEISKEGNTVTASVAWTRTLHLVANASLILEFDASATR